MPFTWNTIGHRAQLERLENEVQQNNVSHAYLFAGPDHIGKSHVAKAFAAILLCPNRRCLDCDTCLRIKNGSHPDLISINDEGQSIKIDDVRRLVRKSNLTTQGGKRIVLIENMERMPIEAQNAFLKTLEEPSKDSIFLLTSSKTANILDTIHSRVRTYDFSVLGQEDLKEGLKQTFVEISEEKGRKILGFAQGRPGLAFRLMESEELLESYQKINEKIDECLSQNNLCAKFKFVENIEKSPEELTVFLDVFASTLRKMVHDDLNKKPHPLNKRFPLATTYNLFESLTKTSYLIKRNVNKKLILENLMIQTER